MRVAAPGSSANVGSGFDAIGIAVDLPFVVADEPADDLLAAEERHPVAVAFAEAGGSGDLWWRSPIPPGRGLGFSGAARVAGAFLARRRARDDEVTARRVAFEVAADLEGHADNAAASAFGGVVVAAGGVVVPVRPAVDVELVVWWPSTEVSTKSARAALPASVPMSDAVFNVGRAALLVAALVAGDRAALRPATEDRLHQDARLALSPPSRSAFEALVGSSALAVWLSGSGPTVAAMVDRGASAPVVASLPPEGTGRVLAIAGAGVTALNQ